MSNCGFTTLDDTRPVAQPGEQSPFKRYAAADPNSKETSWTSFSRLPDAGALAYACDGEPRSMVPVASRRVSTCGCAGDEVLVHRIRHELLRHTRDVSVATTTTTLNFLGLVPNEFVDDAGRSYAGAGVVGVAFIT